MSKALVLYFSVYGSTRWVAAEIAKQTGADLTEIEPAVPYESDYDALIRRAQRELERDLRPAIREPLRIDDYDLIFLGYPIWCFTVPMILRTFLEQYDLTGKTVVPFNTHVLADAKIPLYLFIGENDDYYGSDSVKETYAALAKLYREKGLTDEAIYRLLVMDIKDAAWFAQRNARSQHGGGGLAAREADIMNWLFSQRKENP